MLQCPFYRVSAKSNTISGFMLLETFPHAPLLMQKRSGLQLVPNTFMKKR